MNVQGQKGTVEASCPALRGSRYKNAGAPSAPALVLAGSPGKTFCGEPPSAVQRSNAPHESVPHPTQFSYGGNFLTTPFFSALSSDPAPASGCSTFASR